MIKRSLETNTAGSSALAVLRKPCGLWFCRLFLHHNPSHPSTLHCLLRQCPIAHDFLGKPDGGAAATEPIAAPKAPPKMYVGIGGGGEDAAAGGGRRHETVADRVDGSSSDSRKGGSSLSGRPGEEGGDEKRRRRSLLGLEEASSKDANGEGLGGWQVRPSRRRICGFV